MATMREKQLTEYLVENQTRFYRLAYSYLRDREEALDAVQTAVCRALEKQDGLRDTGAMAAWFYHILVHVCLDMLRVRRRFVPLTEDAPETGSYEDPQLEDDSLARRVEALPPETGTVIRLRFYEEMTLQEISEITGANLSTVKSRLYTGLKKLRISLEGADLT